MYTNTPESPSIPTSPLLSHISPSSSSPQNLPPTCPANAVHYSTKSYPIISTLPTNFSPSDLLAGPRIKIQLTISPFGSVAASPHATPTTRNAHPMQTRGKFGIFKPKTCAGELTSIKQALSSSHWKKAMDEEFEALMRNKIWNLI